MDHFENHSFFGLGLPGIFFDTKKQPESTRVIRDSVVPNIRMVRSDLRSLLNLRFVLNIPDGEIDFKSTCPMLLFGLEYTVLIHIYHKFCDRCE